MLAAVDGESGRTEFAADDGGVLHVEAHQPLHFRLAGFGIHRFSTALNDVADAVELGALAAVPQAPEFHLFAVGGLALQPLGHHGEAQRVPVKPAFLEKERNSMAQSRAPSISKMEWGRLGSWMKAS